MTLRRIVIAILFAAGAGLVVLGIQHWLERRKATAVVIGFLEAVASGDRQRAFSFLEATRRDEAEFGFGRKDAAFWKSTERAKFRINELEITGDTARVKVWIEKDGFVLEPVVYLVRTETLSWKITRIESLNVDPQWDDIQREISRQKGKQDAQELREALQGRKGVTIRRAPLPDR